MRQDTIQRPYISQHNTHQDHRIQHIIIKRNTIRNDAKSHPTICHNAPDSIKEQDEFTRYYAIQMTHNTINTIHLRSKRNTVQSQHNATQHDTI